MNCAYEWVCVHTPTSNAIELQLCVWDLLLVNVRPVRALCLFQVYQVFFGILLLDTCLFLIHLDSHVCPFMWKYKIPNIDLEPEILWKRWFANSICKCVSISCSRVQTLPDSYESEHAKLSPHWSLTWSTYYLCFSTFKWVHGKLSTNCKVTLILPAEIFCLGDFQNPKSSITRSLAWLLLKPPPRVFVCQSTHPSCSWLAIF